MADETPVAAKVRLTATLSLVCGLVLAGLSSPLGPPLALIGAAGLAVHLGQAILAAISRYRVAE